MFRSNTPSWVPVFSCIFLSAVGFLISLCLILSLIPLYLNNRSVPKSNTAYPVYTLNQLSFTLGGNSAEQIRIVRDTSSSSSCMPSENMTASIREQLNNMLSEVDAAVVVYQATMSSTSKLLLSLKLYFRQGCFLCKLREQKLIKAIFKKGLTFNIHTEYYTSCALDSIAAGATSMALDADISDGHIVSSPTQVLIGSLVEQGDPCPNRTALVYPTDCNATQASGVETTLHLFNGTFQYYCYYFVTPASATNVQLQFTFASTYGNVGAILVNVTLNSTENLIANGDFELNDVTDNPFQYQYPSWTISECGSYCQSFPGDLFGITNFPSFVASGAGITLSQTAAINTVGRQFVYRLGFWFQCFVNDQDPTESCLLMFSLSTT